MMEDISFKVKRGLVSLARLGLAHNVKLNRGFTPSSQHVMKFANVVKYVRTPIGYSYLFQAGGYQIGVVTRDPAAQIA